MPNSPISFLSSDHRRNSNDAGPDSNDSTPTFTRPKSVTLPATTNQLQFTPPAFPRQEILTSQSAEQRNRIPPASEVAISNTRLESPTVTRTSARDLNFIRDLRSTELSSKQLGKVYKLSSNRLIRNKTFVDRGASDKVRNVLLESLKAQNYPDSSAYLKSMANYTNNEKPVNPDAVLGMWHAGKRYFAANNKPFEGEYEELRDYVPEGQIKSTDYMFNHPPSEAEYLIPDFDKILAANQDALQLLPTGKNIHFDELNLNHLIPPHDLYPFLEARALQPDAEAEAELQLQPRPAKRRRTYAPIVDMPVHAPTPQGLSGAPTAKPVGNAFYGSSTRSSTSDITPTPQGQNASTSDTASNADRHWNSLLNEIQHDRRSTHPSSSDKPLFPTARSTAQLNANTPPTLPVSSSVPTVIPGPAPSVAPSDLNGGQNQISSQQASSQFPDIDASIAHHLDLIRRNETSASQATSGNPHYQPATFNNLANPAVSTGPNGLAGNATLNPAPLTNPAPLQPDDSYSDLFALIESFPVMEPGESTANSTSTSMLSQQTMFNQPATVSQPTTFNDLFNPAVATARTGQLSNVWAQSTMAPPWNGGSTNAPQFLSSNQAYPQPSNQPQAPSQALVTMPDMYPTANSQFQTNFSNSPLFNSSFAPSQLAPSNSFHDYSQFLHQQQPQPQQNTAAPTLYPSMPMNSYSAQQINQYNGPTSNYFTMPATNYSFMPGNSTAATATGISTMPTAPAIGMGGAGGTGDTGDTGAPSAYPYQW